MKWAEALNGFCQLEIIWSIIFSRRWCFRALYQNRKAVGHFNSCCPQSIAFGVSGEFQQGQAKKSLICFLKEDSSLLFVDLYRIVLLLRCWGKAQDWQSELSHRPPYLCFCSKPPLFSRLLSPWCVSSLESDL